jgi:hypothetical protein
MKDDVLGRTIGWNLVLSVSLGWLSGCGGGTPGHLPTASVFGRITYQGKPLAQGEITFIPTASGTGVRAAYGRLDEQGRYCLTTYRDGDGAILGEHRVAIASREEVSPDAGKQVSPDGLVTPGISPGSLIPERYANPATSGLKARVGKGGNEFNFELRE